MSFAARTTDHDAIRSLISERHRRWSVGGANGSGRSTSGLSRPDLNKDQELKGVVWPDFFKISDASDPTFPDRDEPAERRGERLHLRQRLSSDVSRSR